MRKSTKNEKETALKIVQKRTKKKQPRRFLWNMFEMWCLYFGVVEDRSKNWMKEQIDNCFER